jgi:hypothetical protein
MVLARLGAREANLFPKMFPDPALGTMSFSNTVFVRAVRIGHILALVSGALGLRATTVAAYIEDGRG